MNRQTKTSGLATVLLWAVVALLSACATDQYVRESAATHDEVHAAEKQEIAKREQRIAEKAAHRAASEADRRLSSSHANALKLHKIVVEKATMKIINERLVPLAASISDLQEQFRAHLRSVEVANNKRLLDEERHELRIDEKLKGVDARTAATLVEVAKLSGVDAISADKRTEAFERLKESETKDQRAELDIIDLRKKVDALETKQAVQKDLTKDAKTQAKDANKDATNAQLGVVLAILIGLLNELRKWLKERRAKKKETE